MPKVKIPRKSTFIDMTAMCDVAFLLLTFFMLATKFKPDEAVTVVTPSSISEIVLPDNDIMLLTVDKKGRVFFSIDNPKIRKGLIEDIDEYKNLNLSEEEMNTFAHSESVGVPFNQLKSYLDATPDAQKQFNVTTSGIPTDTSVKSEQNELAAWIRTARNNNPKLRIVIKADVDATFPMVKNVINTLAGWKIFKFNLITNLKAVPPGTAAFEEKMGTATNAAHQ